MKYQEPENEQLRRRRRDKSISEPSNNASTGTNNHQTPSMLTMPAVKQSSPIHSTVTPMPSTSVSGMHARSAAHDITTAPLPDSPTRRQQQQSVVQQQQQQHSSAASGGVISASLQLSVQLPADTPQPLNLAADLPDIPYIEDYGSDIGEFGELALQPLIGN